jgi:ABC-2 type transport system permease protein
VVIFFLVFTAAWFFFINQFLARNVASLREYFQVMVFAIVVIIPALTMRSWAEEKKLGTDELLLTLPFREAEVVLGKFLAAVVLFITILALTVPVPLLVQLLGDLETGAIIGQYIGVFCLGVSVIAIGQFISALGENQIGVLLGTIVVLLLLTGLRYIEVITGTSSWFTDVCNYLSLDYHFQSFKKGLLDTRDLFYFLLLTTLFLQLTIKVVRLRKLS